MEFAVPSDGHTSRKADEPKGRPRYAASALAVAAEVAVSVAMRELFVLVLVDQFTLRATSLGSYALGMRFRSPLRTVEVLGEGLSSRQDEQPAESANLVARQAALALANLFRTTLVEPRCILAHAADFILCTITARISVS